MARKRLFDFLTDETPRKYYKYNVRIKEGTGERASSKEEDALCYGRRAGYARYMGNGTVKVVYDSGKTVLHSRVGIEELN